MSIRAKLTLLLSVLFLTAISNLVFIYVSEKYSDEKLAWIIHTQNVLNESDKFLSSMASTETGQRGFLLTLDVNYLGIYHKGGALAETYLNNLLTLTADNPEQQQRLKHIQSLMDKKFTELQQTVELAQHKDIKSYNLAIDIVKQNSGKKFMDEIRESLFAFEYEEHLLLETRKGSFKESRAYIKAFSAITIIFFVFLGFFTAYFVKRNLFVPLEMLLSSTSKVERGEKQNIKDMLPNDEMGHLLFSFYQMSEKIHKKTESLTYKAHHDQLTGLKNRIELDQEIQDSIFNMANNDTKIAVFFIDLNGFKQLNDTYGHDAGDLILIETADRLQKTVRSNDLVFRLGGDEFIVIIKDIRAKADAKIVANNILQGFAMPMMIQGDALEVSLSIGIALSPDDSRISKEIIKFADLAMYKAKRDNQTSYQFFEPALQIAKPNKRLKK